MTGMEMHKALLQMQSDLDNGNEAAAKQAWKSLTVFDRSPIAVLILSAAGQPVSKKKLAEVLRCSASNLSTPANGGDLNAQIIDALIEAAPALTDWLVDGLASDRTLADADREVEEMKANLVAERATLGRRNAELQELERLQQAMAALVREAHTLRFEEHREVVRTTREVVRDHPTLTAVKDPTDD